MADTIEGFVVKMGRLEALVQPTLVAGIRSAALAMTTIIRAETEKVAPGGRLRGVGRKGAKIGVGFDILGEANPTALVKARGPFHLVERDTKAHVIVPKKRGKRKAVLTPYGPRARVQSPGTRGKHPFAKGVVIATPVVGRAVEGEVKGVLRTLFG